MNKITYVCKEELLYSLYENLSECAHPIDEGQEEYIKGWVASLQNIIEHVESL